MIWVRVEMAMINNSSPSPGLDPDHGADPQGKWQLGSGHQLQQQAKQPFATAKVAQMAMNSATGPTSCYLHP